MTLTANFPLSVFNSVHCFFEFNEVSFCCIQGVNMTKEIVDKTKELVYKTDNVESVHISAPKDKLYTVEVTLVGGKEPVKLASINAQTYLVSERSGP